MTTKYFASPGAVGFEATNPYGIVGDKNAIRVQAPVGTLTMSAASAPEFSDEDSEPRDATNAAIGAGSTVTRSEVSI